MRFAIGTGLQSLTLTGYLCLALSTAPASAVTGYSVFADQELVAVDLETGTVEVLGELTIGDVTETAFDGHDLFVVARQAATSSLYRVDLETATVNPIGDLGNNLAVNGLTFSADGVLWMSTTNGLYVVDPMSATTTLIGSPDRPLLALAARDDQLFGWTATDFTADLVTIDPESATTSVAATLPEMTFSGGLLAGMAFDLDGSLWAFAVTLPPIEPHILLQTFYEIGDPTNPQPVRTFSVEAPFVADPPLFAGLVVVPGDSQAVLEIPTLSRAGWTVLALMLFAAGLMTLSRRRVRGRSRRSTTP